MIADSWRARWEYIIPFLALPADLRRAVYTTNSIENLNRQIRKAIKTRGHFPDEQAATKLIYLAIQRAETKWRTPYNWTSALRGPQDPLRRPTPRLTHEPSRPGLTHRRSDTLAAARKVRNDAPTPLATCVFNSPGASSRSDLGGDPGPPARDRSEEETVGGMAHMIAVAG